MGQGRAANPVSGYLLVDQAYRVLGPIDIKLTALRRAGVAGERRTGMKCPCYASYAR